MDSYGCQGRLNSAPRAADVVGRGDEAWRVVTEPDHLREWLADDVEIDLVEGGLIAKDALKAGSKQLKRASKAM